MYTDLHKTNSMNHSPFWETNNSAVSQRNPLILQDTKVNYSVLKNWPLVPSLSHTNPVHTLLFYIYFWFTLILSFHLHLGLPRGLIPSLCPTKILRAFTFSPVRAISAYKETQ